MFHKHDFKFSCIIFFMSLDDAVVTCISTQIHIDGVIVATVAASLIKVAV